MKRSLVISERAEADLLEIWVWTHNQFGEAQADQYLAELEACMRSCGSDPQLGKNREAIRPGYRSRHCGKHMIFYTHTSTQVVIQRVLHGSMDVESHLVDRDPQ